MAIDINIIHICKLRHAFGFYKVGEGEGGGVQYRSKNKSPGPETDGCYFQK